MKKLLLSCFFIFPVAVSFSQTNVYHKFPTNNAIWKIDWWVNFFDNNMNCCCGLAAEYNYVINGDTTINMTIYKKINRWGITYMPGCFNGNPLPGYGYMGALRDDTIQKKIFFRLPNSSSDTLLYNFNLNVGDTVKSFLSSLDCNNGQIVAIDSILIGNNYRKRFKLSCNPTYIIEGIGATTGLLEKFGSFETAGDLLCFSVNNQTLYPNNNTCQPLAANPVQKIDLELKLSPNPFTTETLLTIGEPQHNASLSLYNMYGQEVRRISSISGKEVKIRRDGLPAGVYLIRFTSGYSHAVKVIIAD